jgi:hypothetical protein
MSCSINATVTPSFAASSRTNCDSRRLKLGEIRNIFRQQRILFLRSRPT